MFLGMRIAFAAALVGFAGLVVLKGWGVAGGTLGFIPYRIVAHYPLSVIPLFIIMGYFAYFAGLTRDLLGTARQWVGHLPGGLAIATVFGCAGFGACSGSSTAAAAVMGKVAIPEMRRYGYDPKLAAGVVAASGTLAGLIPPSFSIVIYGIITETSIGAVLVAGLIPGIVSALIYAIMLYFWARFRHGVAQQLPPASWKERLVSLRSTWGVLLLGGTVLGGLYTGVFTPTEAGGVGACGAFLIALLLRQLNWSNFKEALLDTGKTTAMIFAIMVGILILLRVLALSGLTKVFTLFMVALPWPPLAILVGILFVMFILGTFMSGISMMMVTLPLVMPVVTGLGYDPVWFGIIVIKMTEIAIITPPVGVNVFVTQSVAPDIPLYDVFKGILPFLVMDILTVALLIAFPQIVLFLPQAMRGG